ncbi:MAG: hypothetical protein NT027_09985 [Proteobacteria bacterium]|nr:hypothetical protein [Pseudomonadota bacterium]
MYIVTKVLASIIGRMPYPILDFLSKFLAVLAYDILRVRRTLIESNIKIAFPNMSPQDCAKMGRASLYHFAATLFETIAGGPKNMLENIQFENRVVLDEALKRGLGAYMVCIHSGNFEVLGAAISTFWRPITVPVKFVGKGGFDRYVHEQRQRYNIFPVRSQKKGDGYRAIVDALVAGRPVGFMLDQARHGEPRLPLFGKPAKTNTSLPAIWRKNPSPVIPLIVIRLSFGKHLIRFFDEVEMLKTSDDNLEDDITKQSIRFNQLVEKLVVIAPQQYWWIHNRWK